MGRTNELYMMMRLAYEQAVDDYNNKKADTVLSAYKKYHIINVGMGSVDPQGEILNFFDEDNSQESMI
jgi:hypothetical protein|tara:strand:- start:168 stop:371 length:204 start_codon:yes stop_codon:yes gene_type:complete